MLKERKNRSPYTPRWELIDPPSNLDWTIFYTLQFLDVATTVKGLTYDCVTEANPIFGENPSVDKLIFYKIGLLTPAIEYDRRHGQLNQASIQGTNTFMLLVIANNLNVIQKASNRCEKR